MIATFKHESILATVERRLADIARESVVRAIAFFDLSGSTDAKLSFGHEAGTNRALKAVTLAREIVATYHGQAIKDLGDGVLAVFEDPLKACLAALGIKTVAAHAGLTMTVGLTLGLVDIVRAGHRPIDVYGTAVDRCARIGAHALPGQVLMDLPLLEAVRAQLRDYSNLVVAEGRRRPFKGIGEVEIFELSTADDGLRRFVKIGYQVYEEGRVPLSDKVHFVRDAQSQVVEVGTGATTFARFFSSHRPSEFRGYVEALVAKGVTFTLLVMDPEWSGATSYLEDREEGGYVAEIKQAISLLREERRRIASKGLPGTFTIRVYRSFPSMHALCVDPDDAVAGRMLVSPYCYGLTRAESPVLEFSRFSNCVLFDKYWQSIRYVMERRSTEVT